MADREYRGLLFIGDPHLASRAPGFRKDDYSRAILRKLDWALDYARDEALLPAVLGDWFHYPKDNANWLLVELLAMLRGEILGVAGNHDCSENELGEDDTLSILDASGRIRLLERGGPWRGRMAGTDVVVGGTAWGARLPKAFEPEAAGPGADPRLVFWIAHHDVKFKGYEDTGRFSPHEIPGVDVLVNGHIHRPLDDAVKGATTWLNPGSICRITRGDASRDRRPSALRIDVDGGAWSAKRVELPFEDFDKVFHPEIAREELEPGDSMFVRGLEGLETIKTQSGAGLMAFLEKNLDQFDPRVAAEIRALAREVCIDGEKS